MRINKILYSCPQRLKAGDVVISAEKADVKPGNACLLSMPVGTIVHNIEFKQVKVDKSQGPLALRTIYW